MPAQNRADKEPWERLSPAQQEWLSTCVSYFRRFGFFDGWGAGDADVLRRIHDREKESTLRPHRGPFGDRPAPSEAELEAMWAELEGDMNPLNIDAVAPVDPLADFQLLKNDQSRVWWEDAEAGVGMGEQVYAWVLKQFAGMSRGLFRPEAVQEEWSGKSGPIRVRFVHRGRLAEFSPRYCDDWLDTVAIVQAVNQELVGSGLKFEMYDTHDQTAIVVALTAEEKESFQRDRGWEFPGGE